MASQVIKKRRFPRRRFQRPVGILFDGRYFVGDAIEISEGGMLIGLKNPIPEGRKIVVSFMVPSAGHCILRGEIRYNQPVKNGFIPVGVQFANIEFTNKRMIREYIAAKTQEEAKQDKATILAPNPSPHLHRKS